LARGQERVLATCRSPETATSLLALKQTYGVERLEVLRLDVQDDASIEQVGAFIETSMDGRLDRLVNVTGLLHDEAMRPETRYQALNRQQLMKSMEVNAVGNILVAARMLPFLVEAGGRRSPERPAVVANLSARVSSLADNRLGGWYSYRSSKAALNQLTKTLSVELERKKQNVSAILLHPGTCVRH
jgi:NAD(P)-dependent dehydrogenase (short-subunit alcohol dehydrogenase family)